MRSFDIFRVKNGKRNKHPLAQVRVFQSPTKTLIVTDSARYGRDQTMILGTPDISLCVLFGCRSLPIPERFDVSFIEVRW